MHSSLCPVCETAMLADVLPGTLKCRSCGFYRSAFSVEINRNEAVLDEGTRVVALSAMRQLNASAMLDRLARCEGFPVAARVLEVGSGHGWFLAELKSRGYRCVGVEPDSRLASIAQAAGHSVLAGFYPDVVPFGSQFELVFFNDVFEHLPDVSAVAQRLRRDTTADGWVVVNLPVSDGAIFRTARLLARVGVSGPYKRMWQEGMPSPHLSYFSRKNILAFFGRHGFQFRAGERLRAVSTDRLMSRIRYDRRVNRVRGLAYYAATVGLAPLLPFLPADIRYFAFQKT